MEESSHGAGEFLGRACWCYFWCLIGEIVSLLMEVYA